MNDERKEATSAEVGREPSAVKAKPKSSISQLREQRRAALNLMEDALAAQSRAEELNARLLQEVGVRSRAEEALHESEEHLRLITEAFRDFAIFSLNTDGMVQTWNPGAEMIFRYTEKEMIGQNGRILFVPEDQVAGAPEHEMETARTKGRAADERLASAKGRNAILCERDHGTAS